MLEYQNFLDKAEIRRQMLSRRSTLGEAEIRQVGSAICRRLLQLPELRNADFVAAYFSHAGEVVLDEYLKHFLRQDGCLLMPRFNRRRGAYDMVLLRDLEEQVCIGHWGIREPCPTLETAPETLLQSRQSVWLIPGVAFDLNRHRVGHGKGFYDRLLQCRGGRKIGIAYDWQILPQVPFRQHDIGMDSVLTEKREI